MTDADVCGPEILKSYIPNHLQQIKFSQLKEDTDFSGKFIVGKVFKIWPIQKTAKCGYILKLLILEVSGEEICEEKLTVFLFDGRAQDAAGLKEQEYIALSGFTVEPLTSSSSLCGMEKLLPLQILLAPSSSTEENSAIQIWIARRKSAGLHENGTSKALPETSSRCYTYTLLNELEVAAFERYNIYGVVNECEMKSAKSSQAPYMEVVLSDPTMKRFQCLILGKESDTFPDIHPSDIVRIHRLQVDKFRGNLKGKCFTPKDVLVFSSSPSDDIKPVTDAATYVFTDEDETKVKELKDWIQSNPPSQKTISQFQVGEYGNIVCQVVSVITTKQEHLTLIKVWDGTKISCPLDMGNEESVTNEKKDDVILKRAKHCLVSVFAYDCHSYSAAKLEPSQYVELRNVHLYIPSFKNIPQLCLHEGTSFNRGITLLNSNDDVVKVLFRNLETLENSMHEVEDLEKDDSQLLDSADLSLFNAITSQQDENPVTENNEAVQEWWKLIKAASVPIGHSHIPPKSLCDVVNHRAPHKFRVIASVFSYDPCNINKLIHLYCEKCHYISEDAKQTLLSFTSQNGVQLYHCPKCNELAEQKDNDSPPVLRYVYLLCLWLQDGTAQIEAFLHGNHAVNFFQGISPESLLDEESESAQTVKSLLSAICPRKHPVPEKHSIHPVLDCCIMKYNSGGKARYQIFDTILK